ncbi:tetraacyldisaccharide 4'-kinase [Lysobacter xinjiangensis]|uniref:Tetraacyldisaccharide 4'-kinase n=1 Tax=Cognatilysobacter xinjiangensis TaxID=546892 RepID=A0ABQ3BSP3_9GAMM|nr:tetraacyldisaccharide 4'-kinase [Lysobacter xinjiangensis]GGZ55708.1 tetraacyldisaccharide 4'-kinase [Lysobacter xinjiangensis]
MARTPRHWYGDAPVPLAARVLEPLYAALTRLRGGLYRRRLLHGRHPGVPVVVIGNVTAGGTGKTPMTVAVVERLRDAGWSPGVASRGYGRRGKAPLWVEAGTSAVEAGDEPLLIARRTGVPVRVDRDRAAAARALVAAGCDVIVCDDGLQHYRLARDIEIEVVDGRRRYGNGRLLPAGPLREPAERASRCDFRVVNFGDGGQGEAGFGEWPMRLAVRDAMPLQGRRARPLTIFTGQRVHAVAGIGDPARFFDTLKARGIAVIPHAFPDHHAFQPADLAFTSPLPVLMTEKDAVKCVAFAPEHSYAVPVSAELPEAFWTAFIDRLDRLRRPRTP